MEEEKKIHFEEVFIDCNIKEESEEETTPVIYNSTTDYILNKPLKPLPDALQKILPSILSKKIHFMSKAKQKTKKVDYQIVPCFGNSPLRNCQFCNFSTSLKIDLDKHVNMVHRGDSCNPSLQKIHRFEEPRSYKCLDCNFSTSSKLVLLKHMARSNQYHFLEETETKYFNCHVCDFNTTLNVNLRRHLCCEHSILCRDWKIFKCEHCSFVHAKQRNLKQHLIARHSYEERKFFRCDVCFSRYLRLTEFPEPQIDKQSDTTQFPSETCDCYSELTTREPKQRSKKNQFRTLSYFKV